MFWRIFLNGIANPLASAILHSPLHRVLSGRLLLLSFSGRRTGRRFSFPVDYRVDCHGIQVLTSRQRHWWRNFQEEPRTLTLRFRGAEYAAEAQAITEEHLVAGALSDRFGWGNEQADSRASEWVLLRIEPEEALALEPEVM